MSTFPKYDSSQSFCDLSCRFPIHFFRLVEPMTWVSDRWCDDHMRTVLIRCRSRAGGTPDLD